MRNGPRRRRADLARPASGLADAETTDDIDEPKTARPHVTGLEYEDEGSSRTFDGIDTTPCPVSNAPSRMRRHR